MALTFEWDQAKRREVFERRGVDLVYAAGIFGSYVVTTIDARRDYGETRLVSVGLVDGECFVVVHTTQGDIVRLITAWRGGRRERGRYQARYARRNQSDA